MGLSPASDRAIAGDVKSAIYVNPRGVEVLASAKGVPISNWYVGVILPTAEAFAPVREMTRHMLVAAGILSLLTSALVWGLTWWMLKRELFPMIAAAKTLDNFSVTNQPPRSLPITSHGEVGDLIQAFNRLLEALARRESALRQSEQRFKDLVNTTDGVVWEADARTFTFTFISKKAEELLGYAVDDWYRPGFWVDRLHPEDKGWAPAYCASCTQKAEPHNFEYRFLTKDGRVVWLHDIVTVVVEEGQPRWLRGIMIDITRRKQSEAQLQASLERLSLSNTELERFAYVASHDLREPVRTVVSFSQLLSRKLHDAKADELQEYLDYVVDAAKRMDQLVSDLLAYSRVSHDEQPFEGVDLNDVLNDVKTDLAKTIDQAQGLIVADPLPKIMGIKLQLYQLFQNIIANALKFRRADLAPRIDLSVSHDDNTWHLQFADNGIGIDAKYAEQIFVIFKRLHTAQAYPGTGVGLAICRRIMERHNGRIWAEPRADQPGTVFHLVFYDLYLEDLSESDR